MRGERYSRHWYDLAAIAQSNHYDSAIAGQELRHQVAVHKSMFFAEKGNGGFKIDYYRAVTGSIQLIPQGDSLIALGRDYTAMLEDGLLALHQPNFAQLIEQCRAIELRINQK